MDNTPARHTVTLRASHSASCISMCLILFAIDAHPQYSLILAANRDEYHARRTQSPHWWPERPDLLAGRDLEAGGTWFGIRRDGRLAAITNYRQPRTTAWDTSRGDIARGFLLGDATAEQYLQQLAAAGDRYAGFNLLLGENGRYWHYCNRSGAPARIAAGVHGLSNATLDTPWPKVRAGSAALAGVLQGHVTSDALFAILADTRLADDSELPDTGVGADMEKFLSPRFICGEDYGTRASTILTISRDGDIVFHHRDFTAGAPQPFTELHWNFRIDA
jgi:uncharacterized protein with NRDE domain